MERLKEKFKKVCVLSLLLGTILTFSQCKKDGVGPLNNDPLTNEVPSVLDSQSLSSGSGSVIQVNVSTATSDGGFAVRIPMDAKLTSDTNEKPSASVVRVFENGVEIGPAHSDHEQIRNLGKGRFSHKASFLYLSASDNSDPRKNGKKYTYTVNGQAVAPPVGVTPPVTDKPTAPVTAGDPIGYASVNGKTTGGAGGQTVTVTTIAALTSALTSKSPLIIQVSGTITGTGLLQVESNKSIIGLSGSKLIGAGLLIYGKNNVIVRNMNISKVRTYSNIIIKEGSHHVWVDHCELSSELVSDWDYYDGLLDVGTGADYVTLSWNKLHDNHKAMLIGFSYTRPDDANHLNVTVHHNYFYNVSERTPDVRYGHVHVFNNYMQNAGYVGALMGAQVRVENNYFKSSSLPIRTEISPVPGFISGLSTNIFESSGANRINSAASSWIPTYEYKSALNAAADVPALLTKGAGATL